MKTRTLIAIAGMLTTALGVTATLLAPAPKRAPPAVTPVASHATRPSPLHEPEPTLTARSERVIRLDEVRIVGIRRPNLKAKPTARSEPKLVPCSAWRALGPVYSAPSGTIPRQRHVQLLCPENAAAR